VEVEGLNTTSNVATPALGRRVAVGAGVHVGGVAPRKTNGSTGLVVAETAVAAVRQVVNNLLVVVGVVGVVDRPTLTEGPVTTGRTTVLPADTVTGTGTRERVEVETGGTFDAGTAG
jgi:hypothetical protein